MKRIAKRVLASASLLLAAIELAAACGQDAGLVDRSNPANDASVDTGDVSIGDSAPDGVGDGSDGFDGSTADLAPIIPVGFDAYRMWDRLAHVRLGTRAYLRSTYDRTGGNHAA